MSCGQIKPQENSRLGNYKNISIFKPEECIFCKSEKIVKWGFRYNCITKKQRWKCKSCSETFTIDDGFFHLHKKRELVTACLDLYAQGLSLRKIKTHINQFTPEGTSHMQVLRWIRKYSKMIKNFTDNLEPELSRIYHADEIFVSCKGQQHYFWDIIDKGTRYLVSTHYSTKRDSKSAKILFLKAKQKPLILFTDSLQGYKKAFRKVWGTRNVKEDRKIWIKLKGDRDKRNNIVERIQGTIRERIKVMRAFKDKKSAEAILDLFVVYYNFVRIHQGIGMTPAQKAGLNLNLGQNKWLSLINKAKFLNTNYLLEGD